MYDINKFIHSVVWFSLGIVLSRIKYLLLSILIIQLGFKEVAIFYVTIYLTTQFSLFANRLASSGYNRFLRNRSFIENKANLNAAVNSSLQFSFLMGLIMALMVFFMAKPIALFLKSDLLLQTVELFAIAVPFLTITNQVIQILSLLTKYKAAIIFHNIIEALGVLVTAYLTIIVFHLDIVSVLAWQIATIILSSLLALYLLSNCVPKFRYTLKILETPIKISHVIFLNSFFVVIFKNFDVFVMGYYFGVYTLGKYVGLLVIPHLVYEIATNSFGMFIHTAISFSLDKKKLIIFSQKVTEYILILSSAFTLIVLLYPDEIPNLIHIHIKFDPLVLRILSVAFFIKTISWVGGQILITTKNQRDNMIINSSISLLAAILFIIAIPKYGFLGAGLVFLITSFVDMIIKIRLAYKEGVFFISDKSIKVLLISLFFYSINLLTNVKIGLFFSYFPITFIFTLIGLGCIEGKDLLLIKKHLKRKLNPDAPPESMF